MLKPGLELGGYVLETPLGEGGFGSVWQATSPVVGPVALKILHQDALEQEGAKGSLTILDRFLEEVRILKRLDHPGLVKIHGVIDDRSRGYVAYAMERLQGQVLQKVYPDLDWITLLDVFSDVADTLGYLHQQSVIHRDVKPDNIFLCQTGPGQREFQVKLLDFGVAKAITTTLRLKRTQAGAVLGTLRALAPEAFEEGPATPALDQWGMGVSLYICLTGAPPFDSYSVTDLIERIQSEPHPRPNLLPHLEPSGLAIVEPILDRLLVKDPKGRFPSATVVAGRLKVALREMGGASLSEDMVTVPDGVSTDTVPGLCHGAASSGAG